MRITKKANGETNVVSFDVLESVDRDYLNSAIMQKYYGALGKRQTTQYAKNDAEYTKQLWEALHTPAISPHNSKFLRLLHLLMSTLQEEVIKERLTSDHLNTTELVTQKGIGLQCKITDDLFVRQARYLKKQRHSKSIYCGIRRCRHRINKLNSMPYDRAYMMIALMEAGAHAYIKAGSYNECICFLVKSMLQASSIVPKYINWRKLGAFIYNMKESFIVYNVRISLSYDQLDRAIKSACEISKSTCLRQLMEENNA